MVTLDDSIKGKIQEYVKVYTEKSHETIGDSMVLMVIDMLCEKFIAVKSYPSSWTEEEITFDVNCYFDSHSARIALKIPEIVGRMGAEGEITHNENGINRTYANGDVLYNAFPDVVPFAIML